MIRIPKPTFGPNVLETQRGRGKLAAAELRNTFDAAPQDYSSGAKKFDFDGAIYGHKSVKEMLIEVQHGKCCFCESKIRHVSYGDVEHFRPKSAFRQQTKDKDSWPGYYWLAYDWSNLYLSCQICNQQYKRTLFPLKRPSRRARNHHDNIAQEEPLLIDPSRDDPARYLTFRHEIALGRNRSRRGKATIEIAGLNRPDLVERRREHFGLLTKLREFQLRLAEELAETNSDASLVAQRRRIHAEIKDLLDGAIQDAAEFAAMARIALS